MMSLLFGTGPIAVLNGFIWGNGGKTMAGWRHTIGGAYAKYVTPTLDRWKGLRVSPVTITREDDIINKDGSKSLVFKFSKVSTFDTDKTKRELEDKELKKEKKEKKKKEEVEEEEITEAKNAQYYDVTVTIKNEDIRLGEIDFLDWKEQNDFEVTVIRKGKGEIKDDILNPQDEEDKAEYDKVLDTINKFAKISIQKDCTPNQKVTDKMQIKGNYYIDLVKQTFGFGKPSTYSFDTDSGKNARFSEEDYMDGLLELAMDRAEKKKDYNIIVNYYSVIEQSLKNEKLAIQKARIEPEKTIKEHKREKKKSALTIGIAALVTLIAAAIIIGLIVLTIAQPLIGGPILSFVFATFSAAGAIAIKIFGTKLAAAGSTLFSTMFMWGLSFKFLPQYKKTSAQLAAEDLKNLDKALEEVDGEIERLDELKEGAKLTLEAINKLKPGEPLVLKKAGDMGAAIVCKHLERNSNNTPLAGSQSIALTDSNITDIGAKIFAQTLERAQNPGQLNLGVRELDLRGNKIGPKGLEVIAEALSKNFTLTSLRYDKEGVAHEIKKKIREQLLINRYLRQSYGIPKNMHSKYKKLAMEKIRDNFDVTILPPFANKDDKKMMDLISVVNQQNAIFKKLRSEEPEPWDYARAYDLDKERFVQFISLPSLTEDVTGKKIKGKKKIEIEKIRETKKPIVKNIQKAVIESPLKLCDLDSKERTKLLTLAFPIPEINKTQTKHTKKNIKFFVELLDKMPKDRKIRETLLAIISSSLGQLDQLDHNEFKVKLEEKRKQIAQYGKFDKLDPKTKMVMLTVLDQALHPNLGKPDSFEFKKHQLQQLVINSPAINLKQTFEEFINIYSKLNPKEASALFQEINEEDLTTFKSNLINFVRDDIANNNYSQLKRKDLSVEHKRVLFECCFEPGDKDGYKEKAILFANIFDENAEKFLGSTDIDIKNFRDQYLAYAVEWPSGYGILGSFRDYVAGKTPAKTFAEIKPALVDTRKKVLTKGNWQSAKILDQPLQTLQQARFIEKFVREDGSGFKKPEAISKSLDDNYELRRFDFAKLGFEPDENTKKYITNIIRRNRLKDKIENQPALLKNRIENLSRFMAVYKKMEVGFLTPSAIDPQKLTKLIEPELLKENMCEKLKELDDEHRLALLEIRFHGQKDYKQKTSLVSLLITQGKNLDSRHATDNTSIEHLISQAFSGTSYDELIIKLEKQRKALKAGDNGPEAQLVEKILQTQLQRELKALDLTDKSVIAELEEHRLNKFLREFETGINVHPDVVNYLKNIITKNRLQASLYDNPNHMENSEILREFTFAFEKIKDNKTRKEILAEIMEIDGDTILKMVKNDMDKDPPCSMLLLSDKKIIVEILTACREKHFAKTTIKERLDSEQSHSYAIATMVSELIDLFQKDKLKDKQYIWRIFDWATYSKWTFKDYITNLKTLNMDDVDSIIQNGLQEDIIYRLSVVGESQHRLIEQELIENYDLIDSEELFTSIKKLNLMNHKTIGEFSKDINFICKRNLLKREIERGTLNSADQFFKRYQDIPSGKHKEALEKIDKLKVLKLVAQDLGTQDMVTCKKLRSLSTKTRINLLAHCFSINEPTIEDAYKKALLVSDLLDIDTLFEQTDKISQEIKKYLIYWAITPEGYGYVKSGKDTPYYTLNNLLKGSKTGYSVDVLINKLKEAEQKPLVTIRKKLQKSRDKLDTIKLEGVVTKPVFQEPQPSVTKKTTLR